MMKTAMKCVVCRHGITRPATTTLTFERGTSTVVFKNVPAEVCANCGEAYVDEAAAKQAMHQAEKAVREGVQVDVREFSSR